MISLNYSNPVNIGGTGYIYNNVSQPQQQSIYPQGQQGMFMGGQSSVSTFNPYYTGQYGGSYADQYYAMIEAQKEQQKKEKDYAESRVIIEESIKKSNSKQEFITARPSYNQTQSKPLLSNANIQDDSMNFSMNGEIDRLESEIVGSIQKTNRDNQYEGKEFDECLEMVAQQYEKEETLGYKRLSDMSVGGLYNPQAYSQLTQNGNNSYFNSILSTMRANNPDLKDNEICLPQSIKERSYAERKAAFMRNFLSK